MIKIYLPINRGLTFRPFLVLPKRIKGKKSEAGYLAHERIHYGRQFLFPIIWIAKYFLSARFRWREEKPAWTEEIKVNELEGHKVAPERYAEILSEQYWGMVNYTAALEFVKSLFKKINELSRSGRL